MKKTLYPLLLVLIAGMLIIDAGCAKHDVLKTDEPLVPAAIKSNGIPPERTADKPSLTPTEQGTKAEAMPVGGDRNSALQNGGPATALVRQELDKIYFDFDSTTLSATAREVLTKNFTILQTNPGIKVRVEGHCDERGSDEYNLALGERRAQASVNYLKTMGLHAERLSIISYGKEKPADSGHDEAAWAKNRRDEFVIVQQ